MWLEACVKDLQKNVLVIPVLRHLRAIVALYLEDTRRLTSTATYKYRHIILMELDSRFHLKVLLLYNLMQYMQKARPVFAGLAPDQCDPHTVVVTDRQVHSVAVSERMAFLKVKF